MAYRAVKSCILNQMPLSELLLIEKIRALARQTSGRRRGTKDALGAIRVGIGDDCAVLAGSETHDLLVTTDLCIQDVHFRLDWHPAESVGHRCLTRGLSDIAAMGGEPTAAFLSLSMPAHLPQKWVDGFFKGFQRLAKRFGVSLAGGDIATSPRGISADIVVLGRVPKGKAILRSGARPGDLIYVTGILGCSTEALAGFKLGERRSPSVTSTHYFPQPRLKVGQRLREQGAATAMIDISDGLSTDMAHICTESRVSALLLREAIPFDRSRKRRFGERFEEDTRRYVFALHGGDDYELLFTAPRRKKMPHTLGGTRISNIGEIMPPKKGAVPITIVHGDGRVEPLDMRGWEHFSSAEIGV